MMETNVDLPPEWDELKSIMTDMKACRESGDVEGNNKCAERLIAWRDTYPEEMIAVLKVLSGGDNDVRA